MKFVLTQQEAMAMKAVLENGEHGSTEELANLVKDNKLVHFKICPLKKELEVTIDEAYTVDFLNVYSRFVGLFVSQTKALVHTIQVFNEEACKVVQKHAFPMEDGSNE